MTDPTAPPVLSPLLTMTEVWLKLIPANCRAPWLDVELTITQLLAELDAQRATVARLSSRTCVTCKHGTERDEYGDLVCTQPKMIAAGYASSYFHVPSSDFGCTFHEAALTSPDAEKPKAPSR